jgi:inorganic pyrophosphatase
VNIDMIPVGENPPSDVNVIIEIPAGSEPVKYEIDKASGALFVDRIMHTAMRYPANYGFIPHTLSDDGDPIDALVVAGVPFVSGSVVRARAVGVLVTEDQKGGDEKLLMVPVDALHPYYSGVESYTELPAIVIEQIEHFFAHYKDLEPGKWVKVHGWKGPQDAERLIVEGVERAKAKAA